MVENLKILVLHKPFGTLSLRFLKFSRLGFNLFNLRLCLCQGGEFHKLSSKRRGFLDEPFNSHVNQCQTRIFVLDYLFGNLEMSGDQFKTEDDVPKVGCLGA